MNTYKYANEENTAVNVTGDNNGYVPSTHRFWQEWGIADAIEAGEVEEYQTAQELQAIAEADERSWRDGELLLMDVAVRIAFDRGESTTAISAYRELLRAWPQHANFPDSAHRPTGP